MKPHHKTAFSPNTFKMLLGAVAWVKLNGNQWEHGTRAQTHHASLCNDRSMKQW